MSSDELVMVEEYGGYFFSMEEIVLIMELPEGSAKDAGFIGRIKEGS